MKPLLAHVYEPHRVTYPVWMQPKLNGIRALYQDGAFQSRDELPWTAGVLAHIASELKELRLGSQIILDGELYVHGWPLQKINGAVTPVRVGTSVDTAMVEYHIFDTVNFQQSFETRWNSLPTGIALPHVRFVETRLVSSFNEADAFYKEKVDEGYEGVMYRLGDCPYTTPKEININSSSRTKFFSDKNNRTWHLLKRKDWQDAEFICVGIVEGEGKYIGTLGALVCQAQPPDVMLRRMGKTNSILANYQFNVGSGISDADRDHYFANPPIGRLIKVKYLCLSSDGIPLNPTILAIL